jgi:hypothetical protein
MQARETALREQAFIEWESVVCGERIRQMTLGDMLMLQGLGNPYVAGDAFPEAVDVMQFLWLLSVENKGGRLRKWYQRRALIKRVAQIKAADPLEACGAEIDSYMTDVFQDSPKGSKSDRRPLGVCFMASMLTRLASALGPHDPATGEVWARSPLARIFQYLKAIRASETDGEFKDSSPSDKIMSDWLDETNRNAAA